MPFNTFVSGTPALASDINTYLMEQAVMTFANATARDTALPTPNEGMVAYLEGSNHFTIYDGTQWVITDTAWNTYTPSYQSVTVGNGVSTARYFQIGKVVHLHVRFTLGTTSGISGVPGISLPVATTSGRLHTGFGNCTNGTTNFALQTRYGTTTQTQAYVMNIVSTYLARANITAAVPFTWAATHSFDFNLTYEAA
jgi:hypothetical protein